MHVLINAASAHMGGAYTYLENLVRWLPQVAPGDEFTVCVPEATMRRLGDRAGGNVSLRVYPGSSTSGLRRIVFDQVDISAMIDRREVDVLFSATGFGTFLSSCPEVLLVRNPVYFNREFYRVYRELGKPLARTRLRRWYSEISIRAADVVTFPTRSMMEMVRDHVRLSDKRSVPLHYGFDRTSFFEPSEDPLPGREAMKAFAGEGEITLLNVSTYAVHKNFEVLIRALGRLPRKARSRIRLITTTSREQTSDKAEYDALQDTARERGVDEIWMEVGYVDYAHLDQLYDLADLFVFPSFTESFGHSLVEAMACGLPVIAADTPVNREIVGEAGRYFAPRDESSCANLLYSLTAESNGLDRAGERALERSEEFSWEAYTRELIRVFRSLA